ncbi:ABC transporter permease subunit (plasmid) [Arthrobacter sp. TES]|nr:ABC transporter permease subunit [Arthrobacter sp. TES]
MSSLLTRRKAPSASSTDIPDLASLKIRPRVGIAQWASIALGIYVGLSLLQFLVFNQNWKWDVIFSYLFSQVVINGLLNTIYLTLLTTVCGLILGVIAAWARMSPLVVLRTIAILYIWMMRAMPPLVMLLFVFFFGALAPTLGIGIPFGPTFAEVPANEIISRFSAAIIGLSIYLGAYSAEIFRGGILSLPTGHSRPASLWGFRPSGLTKRSLALSSSASSFLHLPTT